jgi:hypothetical protein
MYLSTPAHSLCGGRCPGGQGGNPCQRMDLQKLLPGTLNLPGVLAILLGTFWWRSGGLGSRSAFGPLLAGKPPRWNTKFTILGILSVRVVCYGPGRGLGLLGKSLEQMAIKNLSCRCPPRLNPSIPDHITWQDMPWEHTEGLPTLRWWPESLFPGFPKMHHFCPANTLSPLKTNFHPPYFLLDGFTLSGNKRFGEIWTKPRISTPIPPFWQGSGTNPAPHSHPWPQTH